MKVAFASVDRFAPEHEAIRSLVDISFALRIHKCQRSADHNIGTGVIENPPILSGQSANNDIACE